MDRARALESEIEDLPTARALIATLQDQLTKSQRELVALRHQLDVRCRRRFGRFQNQRILRVLRGFVAYVFVFFVADLFVSSEAICR